jgi:hypothetical protein
MLQLPSPTMLEPASAAAPSPVNGSAAGWTADGGSLIERLLVGAQDAQDMSSQRVSQHLDQVGTGRISTIDMLRMQADMGAFSVQVMITVRVADDVGRAIQTLSQRS